MTPKTGFGFNPRGPKGCRTLDLNRQDAKVAKNRSDPAALDTIVTD